MEDLLLALVSVALLTAAIAVVWRRLAGSPRSAARRAGRLAVAIAVALLIVGAGVYLLSRSRTFQLAGELVPRVETDEKVIALTFDDGPTERTDGVLAILDRRGAKATFYLSGAEAEARPEDVRRIVAAGHELGNHTYSHSRLYFLSSSRVADEFERADAVFRSLGYERATTVRPPGCKRLLTAPLYLSRSGRVTVTWDLEPDSIGRIAGDAEAMTGHVLERARPGSIVLMHVMYDSRQASRDALPRILDGLREKGYRFVTVSELLEIAGD